jgi:proteasome lid subunit RPN8/RPN11
MTKPDDRKLRSEGLQNTAAADLEPKVEIDSEVTRSIRQHARANSKTEVCGVLIGETVNDTIEIRASIEALNAAQAGTHVTFTQDAWEAIYRVKDEFYSDERIVGWYHSHPGFGVFLSDHDLFIQKNFFSSPGQVAWVYDPHTDEEGCFGWVAGEDHRLSRVAIMDRNGDGVEHTPKRSDLAPSLHDGEDEFVEASSPRKLRSGPAWVRWASIFLTHISMLLLGFALAYILFPRVLAELIDPLTGNRVICDLPYLDRCTPLPANMQAPNPSIPESPPHAATPPHTTPAPAQPASPGIHQ